MKLRSDMTVNGRLYAKGSDVPWYEIYPFFLLHMLMFGGSGFLMAYGSGHTPVAFLYLHGGFAILIYTVFYLFIFGRDEVEWMFINAALGVLGIYSQIGWLLSLFRQANQRLSLLRARIPFLYFVLLHLPIRHAVMDITNARRPKEKEARRERLHRYFSGGRYDLLLLGKTLTGQ